MFHIEPLHPDDWTAAIQHVLARVPAPQRSGRVERCLLLLANGVLDPRGVLVAKSDGAIVGVQVCPLLAGSVCSFWLPAARADCADALVRAGLKWCQAVGCKLAQALVGQDELPAAEPLLRNGFQRTTWMRQLTRDLADVPAETPSSLRFETYRPSNARLFAATLERTYEGTLDCPELNGKRTIDEIIAGHRGQGKFNADLWWLVHDGAAPVGVVLLVEQPDALTWELAYLGVVPECRRRRLAHAMMLRALHALRSQPATRMILAVDERNLPALKLYQALGFAETERNLVLLHFW